MAILDFLKNKEDKEKAKKASAKTAPKVSVKKETSVKAVEKKAEPVVVKSSGVEKRGFSYSVVKEPHISEKATILAENNKYTFKVYTNSNKLEIKKSVEGIYRVDVLGVHIMKAPAKKRRLGRTEGYKKAFTKAVVTIKEGQKIEIF